MKSSRTTAVPIAFLALMALAAPLSQATPDGGPKGVLAPPTAAANPEWRAPSSPGATPQLPDGVIAPLTHTGRLSPNVPEPPARIASLRAEESSQQPWDVWGELKGLDFASTALMYRGVPYRWAGMSSRGMDCSGLVSRVLQSHGIRAPHQSSLLFKMGVPVGLNELQAGDLLFFRTRRRGIGHVGMYLGDGKFIHASSGAGRVVVTPVNDAHYMAMYVGARRIR